VGNLIGSGYEYEPHTPAPEAGVLLRALSGHSIIYTVVLNILSSRITNYQLMIFQSAIQQNYNNIVDAILDNLDTIIALVLSFYQWHKTKW